MVKRYKFNDLKEDKDGMFVKFEDFDKVVGVVNGLRDMILNYRNFAVHADDCHYRTSLHINDCDCGLEDVRKEFSEFEHKEQHKYA